jgi:hypothetical protein
VAQTLLVLDKLVLLQHVFFQRSGKKSRKRVSSMKKLFVFVQCELSTIQTFLWSVASGVIGTLILVGFFSSLMRLDTMAMLVPLVVGMNASFSGFMLIERNGPEIKYHRSLAAATGLVIGIIGYGVINAACLQLAGYTLLTTGQGAAAAALGVVGGWFGGMIADKHRKLKEQAPAL